MAYTVTAYIVTAYIAMAYIAMAYVLMAYVVMAYAGVGVNLVQNGYCTVLGGPHPPLRPRI